MTKEGIAEVLEQIATLLELKGENPFKIRAYTNAARSIETFGGNLGDLKDEETLEKIPGIGKAIAAKIKELVETGSLKFFEELRVGISGGRFSSYFPFPDSARKRSRRSTRNLQGQLDRATAGSLRKRPSRGASRFRQNDAGKTLPGDRERERNTPVRFSSARSRPKLRRCRRSARASRRASGLHRRQLSPSEGNRARPRFHRRDEQSGGDHRVYSLGIRSWKV